MTPPTLQLQPPQIVQRDYQGQLSNLGNKFMDLSTAMAKLPQDLNAYQQLQDKMKNTKEFKENMTSEVLSEMGKDWSPGEQKRFLADVKNSDDSSALAEQWATLLVNRQYQKENKMPVAPVWRQRDYIEFAKPFMKKAEEEAEKAKTTEQFRKEKTALETAKGPIQYRGQAQATMVGETEQPLTKQGQQFIQQYPAQPKEMTEYQKASVAIREARNRIDQMVKGQRMKDDEIKYLIQLRGQMNNLVSKYKTSPYAMLGEDTQTDITVLNNELNLLDEAIRTKAPALAKAFKDSTKKEPPPKTSPQNDMSAAIARQKLQATGKYTEEQIEEYIRQKGLK